jgi:hypothetical protein
MGTLWEQTKTKQIWEQKQTKKHIREQTKRSLLKSLEINTY